MADQQTQSETSKPPYLSFTTLANFLNRLGENPIPSRIDSTILDTYSGGTQSQLIATLRVMGLIGEGGRTLPVLGEIARDEKERKRVMKEWAETFYAEQLELAKQNASAGQLAESFQTHNIKGSTLRKAIVFFLALVDYTELPRSTHFRAPKAPAAGTRSRRKSPDPGAGESAKSDYVTPTQKQETITVSLPEGGTVTLIVAVDSLLDLPDNAFAALRKLRNDLRALGTEEPPEDDPAEYGEDEEPF